MNQLFVFLTFSLIMVVTKLVPMEFQINLSSEDERHICEKQFEEGIKIISVSNKKYLPCWLDKNNS